MTDWYVILLKIVTLFLVILAGWGARRLGYLSGETTNKMSRFVVDIALPALVFTHLLRTVNSEALQESWFVPLLGFGILLVGLAVGYLAAPVFNRHPDQKPTFVFLSAVSNWLYLPLPIVIALYGDEGVRALLLINVGAVVALWTLGVWTIRGGKPDISSLREVATNPGLLATVAGILIAITVPASRTLDIVDPYTASAGMAFAGAIVQSLVMIGSLTVPLTLLVTGSSLGSLDLSDHKPNWTLSGVLVSRLLLAPCATVAAVWVVAQFGATIPEIPRMVMYVVAAMPTAVNSILFAERFGGDVSLSARGIFYTTLLSIVVVPTLLFAIRQLGL